MDKDLRLLKEFSEVRGISGNEKEVSKLIYQELKDVCSDIEHDNLGSTICYLNKTSDKPRILITAHMDEVGFLVANILDNGMLKIHPVGGWYNHVLLSELFEIKTRDGKTYVGVSGAQPPHGLKPEERNKVLDIKDIYVDLGVTNKEETLSLGIRIGDTVTPLTEFRVMNDKDTLLGKAFDDRCAVAASVAIMQELKEEGCDANLVFAGTVQEEVGLRGAKTATYHVKPDVALAIDVSFSYDTPNSPDLPTKLKAGVALSVCDGSVIAHRGLFDYIENIAIKNNIKYTYDMLTAGGTDSGEIHKSFDGVVNMTLSLPCRYFHSWNSMISLSDFKETVKLVKAFVKELTFKDLNEIKESKYK